MRQTNGATGAIWDRGDAGAGNVFANVVRGKAGGVGKVAFAHETVDGKLVGPVWLVVSKRGWSGHGKEGKIMDNGSWDAGLIDRA
jgi:hypothetical protein